MLDRHHRVESELSAAPAPVELERPEALGWVLLRPLPRLPPEVVGHLHAVRRARRIFTEERNRDIYTTLWMRGQAALNRPPPRGPQPLTELARHGRGTPTRFIW